MIKKMQIAIDLHVAGFPLKAATQRSQEYFGSSETGLTVYEYPTPVELIYQLGPLTRFESTHTPQVIIQSIANGRWEAQWCADKTYFGLGDTVWEALAKLWLRKKAGITGLP